MGTILGVTCAVLDSRNQAYNTQQSTYVPTEPSYSNGYSPATTSTTSNSGQINCSSCANSGKCTYCNGTGYGTSGGLGIRTLDKSEKCSHCGGTGICPICHGNHM